MGLFHIKFTSLSLFVLFGLALSSGPPASFPPEAEVLAEPVLYSKSEWNKILAKMKPSLDFKPPGKIPQPKEAGQSTLFNSLSPQIVGGNLAYQGDVPWHALVVPDASNLCGGSLISYQWVLTAAHCVNWHPQFQVSLGTTDRRIAQGGAVSLIITKKVVYPTYTGTEAHLDLALLKFDVPLPSNNPYIRPIRLVKASLATNTFARTKVYVSGFGKTTDDPRPSDVLYWTNNTVITNAVCMSTFGSKIKSQIMCINGIGPRSICHGDSGGALVYQEADKLFTQIGTVSFVSPKSCTAGYPQGFVRTGSYLGWISKTTGIKTR